MSASTLGRRYAVALLGLAKEQKTTDKIIADLSNLSAAWTVSEELRDLATDPTVPRPAAKAAVFGVLDKLGAQKIVRGLVGILADRGRLRYLPDVIEAFDNLAEAETGRVRAEVVTARPMSEPYYEKLRLKLEKITGSQVVLVKKEDPSLIGGVVAKVGDRVFDGSLRNRLDELEESLLARGLNA